MAAARARRWCRQHESVGCHSRQCAATSLVDVPTQDTRSPGAPCAHTTNNNSNKSHTKNNTPARIHSDRAVLYSRGWACSHSDRTIFAMTWALLYSFAPQQFCSRSHHSDPTARPLRIRLLKICHLQRATRMRNTMRQHSGARLLLLRLSLSRRKRQRHPRSQYLSRPRLLHTR